MSAPLFTPVHLLTGFLGSGKTTLLRRLLSDPALANAAVLINEFGEVGLDHHLLERIDETTVLLQSGCLCCTIRGELAAAIRDLHAKRERGLVPAFDRLVIESTGLADPFPVLSTIAADPVIAHHFRSAGTWTTVDAVNAPGNIETRGEARKQIAAADRIFLTKSDLVAPGEAAALLRRLSRVNPGASVADVHDASWTVEDLLRAQPAFVCRELPEAVLPAPAGNGHAGAASAFSMVFDRPVDWTAFGVWLSMLLNRHGTKVLRVKGILDLEGEPRPVAVHGVQHLVHPPVHMEGWPSEDRRSRLVFIVDGLAEEAIRRSFEVFVLRDFSGARAAA